MTLNRKTVRRETGLDPDFRRGDVDKVVVIPAEAGIQSNVMDWAPTFVGVTSKSIFLLLVLLARGVYADTSTQPKILDNVGITQRLGETIPLDLTFNDETGRPIQLSHYFQNNKPVLLTMVYFQCPMLCSEILNGLVRTLRVIPLSAGKDFNILTVSFDPTETPKLAALKKLSYVDKYRRAGAADGWFFLTGNEPNIKKLADAVGFRYAWDPQLKQFAHASTIMILTPQGKLARYFYGVEFPSQDVRLSLVEASNGKIGSLVDQVELFCYHYDPSTGRYGLLIMRVLQLSAGATLLALIILVSALLWQEKHSAPKEKQA
jgi:protein SCO1/2